VRWLDLLLGMRMWTAFLRAMYCTIRYPHAPVSTWCLTPKRCPLKHRVLLFAKPGQPAQLGFKHLGV